MVHLSIIILSYNTQDITKQCLMSLFTSLTKTPSLHTEILIIDNASSDNSLTMLQSFSQEHIHPSITWNIIANTENTGFVRGNNQAVKIANGEYILFLNSDVIIDNVDFESLFKYMNEHQEVGVLTVTVNLPENGIDPASHRGFPTIWNSFCYFSKLEKLFGRIPVIGKLFGGYHLTHLDLKTIHEIDSPTGAFFFTRRAILDKIGAFDEEFFMYGEDLDLAFRIKEAGYKILYYPLFNVTHLKRSSGLKKKDTNIQSKTRTYFYEAMKIFFRKHYSSKYPAFINSFIYWSIDLKRKME